MPPIVFSRSGLGARVLFVAYPSGRGGLGELDGWTLFPPPILRAQLPQIGSLDVANAMDVGNAFDVPRQRILTVDDVKDVPTPAASQGLQN